MSSYTSFDPLSCERKGHSIGRCMVSSRENEGIGVQLFLLNIHRIQPLFRCSRFINDYLDVNHHFLIFARTGPTLEDLLQTDQLPHFSVQEIREISAQIIQAALCKILIIQVARQCKNCNSPPSGACYSFNNLP